MNQPQDLRLALPAAFAWLSAWLATQFPGVALPLGLIAGLGAVAFAALGRRHILFATLAVVLSACALPAGMATVQAASRVPDRVEQALEDGGTALIQFTVAGFPKDSTFGQRIPATLTAIGDRVDTLETVTAPILVFADIGGERPGIGSEYQVEASLRSTEPGDDVIAMSFARDVPEPVAEPHPILEVGNHLRATFVDTARQLPNPGAMLVPGLAVGDEALVDDALGDSMKVSSLTHLTAVSGSNIAIVVAGVIAIGRALGWSRPLRIAAAGFGLAGFVLLVTPQGSVIRASAMALIVLALEARSRPVAGVPVLALAVVGLLTYDPWLSHDYGFALSSAATAGLLLGTTPVASYLERWLPPPLALVIAVPFVAQIACQPILLMLEPTLPIYGVVANLLAAPAAPIATVVGLVACLVGALIPVLGLALAWVAWLPAQWIALVAEAAAALPGASLPWWQGPLGIGAWLLLCVAVVILVSKRAPKRMRAVTGAMLALALVMVAARFTADALIRARDLPEHWRVVACDIGQGDAMLVRGGGATVLIDTGEDGDALHACLAEFKIDRIDLLILSHFDSDHSGAVAQIRVPVAAAWVPDTEEARGEPATAQLGAAGVPVYFGARGDVMRLGDLEWQSLSPIRGADGAPSTAEGNDSSLVVSARPTDACIASCLSLVALGDLGESAQRTLLGGAVQADIVKVSHHGSNDQSPELYTEIGARVGLVSAGEGNGYGHPTADALDILTAAGTPHLRTDTQGHLAVFTRDGELSAWTSRTIEGR